MVDPLLVDRRVRLLGTKEKLRKLVSDCLFGARNSLTVGAREIQEVDESILWTPTFDRKA